MNKNQKGQLSFFEGPQQDTLPYARKSRPSDAIPETPMNKMAMQNGQTNPDLPEKLGKAIRLPVPDFSDPERKISCLEADFPIARINALSDLEGNAGKPIYQMSKWWARRRSSVFRAMLIAAGTQAPEDRNEAAKLVWEHYYCNHQKAGSFKKLKVLDCFMGGGTTLVEGSRLGMNMTGVDLNPVAWFVVKNEMACSDPEQVRALFAEIEKQVKPQVQPFYTTTCPRGHQGRWIDEQTGQDAHIDPIDLTPQERSRYRWEGPEIIYTFWAKHGPCQARGCGHRTPIFKSPLIAEKNLSTQYLELTCPQCGAVFHADLGETRMVPGAERVILDGEPLFTELSQKTARLFKEYDQGDVHATWERADALQHTLEDEPGLCCPRCHAFAGKRILDIAKRHAEAGTRATQRKKKDYGIKKKSVQMYLLIHPEWLKGTSGFEGEKELGGWAGAPAEITAGWYERRGQNLKLIEIRGSDLPDEITLVDGLHVDTQTGTVPRKAHFTCAACGRESNTLESVKATGHTAQVAAYALQCHCPQCDAEGYTYSGRYFKAPDSYDLVRLTRAEQEWNNRRDLDLQEYWPVDKMQYAHMTHERNPLPDHGYSYWWEFFNPRQLLVLSQLLRALEEISEKNWPLDVREQALGTFQQYLQNQSMFSHYDISRDTSTVLFANNDFRPKSLSCENNIYAKFGRGNFKASSDATIEGLIWANNSWEILIDTHKKKSLRLPLGDPIIPGNVPYCASSTDLSFLGDEQFDLVITDPPFGNNLFYADLADFFYVWLRIPLQKWYAGLPEAAYFEPERTPHSLEAIDNPVEHPEDRHDHEKTPFIETRHLSQIRHLSGDSGLQEKAPNPLYRPQPSSDFYCQTLSACWAEAGRLLKDGGIMAFTFHHNEDSAWIDVLKALFDAGYLLVATYPIRSDETKGDAENAAFGSKKIEYDIIHVCRKRLQRPEPVAWSRMRRWVKEEAQRLKELLEHTHGKNLPESDLRVILRGKSLEFYSRHYGQVFTGDGQALDVRDALLGINQLLDDLLENAVQDSSLRPPDSAEPAARLYLRLFKKRAQIERDELHKTLRGTGFSQADLEARGWIRVVGRAAHLTPVRERFAFFTEPGRNRKVIKTDLDQAHFLMGAAQSGLNIETELSNPHFSVKKSVEDILLWYASMDDDADNRRAAQTAAELLARWRARKGRPQVVAVQRSLFDMLEEDA
jgi:adenine-specific DNA methylase